MDTEVTLEEAVQLGSVDADFFGRFFFPKACRQESPDFHKELDDALDSQDDRKVSAMISRGFAKTTKLRVYIARRIAYRISNTILITGKSSDASEKTIKWLKRAVEYSPIYSKAFGLRKGSKWTDGEIEIEAVSYDQYGNEVQVTPITIIGMGMTGSIRGINIDDWRPDLIVCDDPCDEENTGTPEQRKKMSKLFFGALLQTLAPEVDSPFAKIVLLQTVLNKDDLVSICDKDPSWRSLRFSCFIDLPNGKQVSRWPERFPTKQLLEEKESYIRQNMLSTWLMEKECKVTSDETSAFREDWLQYWDTLPKGGRRCLAIDPTPPPRQGKVSLNPNLDDAVILAMQVTKGKFYILEYVTFKSPDPIEFIMAIFTMARKWKIKLTGFETHLFQRVMAFMLRQQMRKEQFHLTVQEVEDKRNKRFRIRDDISGVASNYDLYIRPEHYELRAQFIEFPDVNHDDLLDAVSIGINVLTKYTNIEVDDYIDGEYEEILDPEDPKGKLEWDRGAP